MAHGRRRRMVLAAAVALVGLAVAAEWTRYAPGDPARWGPDLLVGLTWVILGAFVSVRTPATGSGLLMLALGGTWFLGNFVGLGPDLVGGAAAQTIYLHRGVLAQLLLAFPGARPAGRGATVVVLACYTLALVPSLARPERLTTTICGLVVAATAAVRLRRSTGPARRPAGTALLGSLVMVAGFGTLVLLRQGGGVWDRVGLLVYQGTLVALAGLLAAGATRLVRADDEVRRLAVELADGHSTALDVALREAVGDRTLRVGVWSPDSGGYLDATGVPVSSRGGAGRALTHLGSDGKPSLVLEHDASTPVPADVVGALDQVAALIAANTALGQQLRQRADQLSSARRRLVEADTRERLELERQLTSGAGRSLERLDDTLEVAHHGAGSDTSAELDHAKHLLEATLADLERLSRGLYPATLDREGLEAALRELCDRAPLEARVEVVGSVPVALRDIAFFVCAEGLANATKHGRAGLVTLSVRCSPALLSVDVVDDGVGPLGRELETGSGLRGLADRVAAYGGSLALTGAAGGGAQLSAEVPLDGQPPRAGHWTSVSRPSPSGAP